MQARRRTAAVALGAAAALLGLTGCEKPTPLVTVFSGDTSIHDRAFSFCFEGQDPASEPGAENACRYDADRAPKVLEVQPGDEVLVDVDRELAESGWFIALRGEDDQAGRLATQEEHVSSFQPDFSRSPTYLLEVRMLRSPEDEGQPVGLWQFTLVPG